MVKKKNKENVNLFKLNTFSEFLSSNTHTFRELLPNKSKHIFRVHIKHYWHFEGVTRKQYYTLFQTSSNTDIFRELLSNNTTHFSRAYIKHNDIFRVIGKQYYTLFQSLHQTILTFSESYWQTILHTFPELIPSYTDIFGDFLPN